MTIPTNGLPFHHIKFYTFGPTNNDCYHTPLSEQTTTTHEWNNKSTHDDWMINHIWPISIFRSRFLPRLLWFVIGVFWHLTSFVIWLWFQFRPRIFMHYSDCGPFGLHHLLLVRTLVHVCEWPLWPTGLLDFSASGVYGLWVCIFVSDSMDSTLDSQTYFYTYRIWRLCLFWLKKMLRGFQPEF